jgi:molybdate transport system permease protein
MARCFGGGFGLALAAFLAANTAHAERITVAVASNFAEPFAEIAAQFTKTTQHEVVVVSGATGKLYAQVQQGAPFDLFLAADHKRPALLMAQDATRRLAPYAQGRLAKVVRQDAPKLSVARIAIADPQLAPYGAAALVSLRDSGQDIEKLDIIYGQSVANVANFLLTGNVDVGFVAASQVFPSPAFSTETIDSNALTQSMVLLSERAAAQALFAYLQSNDVRKMLPEMGYLAPHSTPVTQNTQKPEFATLWPSIRLSLQLASLTTLILLLIGTPLAWWLTVTQSRLRPVVETVTALPLVVPPTVLGFYLLVLFAPQTGLGAFWVRLTGETLTFSFSGLVVASVLYSLPFAVQPLHTGFQSVGRETIEAAQTMGASRLSLFWRVILPLSRRGVLTATVLSFAHTIGEFGVVLMVGGNLPGKTRVISIEIFNRVELLDYRAAHYLAGGLLGFSFVALLAIYTLNGARGAARVGQAG